MMKNKKEELISLGEKITPEWIQYQLTKVIEKLEINMERYGTQFPSACAINGKYRIKPNDDWTNGFWTGMLCLAYEYTQEEKFFIRIDQNIQSFQERLYQHFVLDHHDIGFLYSLSVGAAYKITGKENYKRILLQAADVLTARYHEKGKFIQAWGRYGEAKEYRLIIDSFINLPLLFTATKLSGDQYYAQIALEHYQTLLKSVFRDDASTYHTYYFDPVTGEPDHGATYQGNSDRSTWARGQAWAILGIPLNEDVINSSELPKIYGEATDLFINHLSKDLIPYWDFDFTDEKPSAKDSSSAAIAACGLLEAEKFGDYDAAEKIAKGLIYQLGERYANLDNPDNEGLLLHGVYAFAEGKGIDEPNLWGDYFYFEALMRLWKSDWKKYW